MTTSTVQQYQTTRAAEKRSFWDRLFGRNKPEEIPQSTTKYDNEHDMYWEIKDDGIFGYVPPKEMTGVEPQMTRLCATISQQLYANSSFEEFKLSTNDNKTEAILYDDHGDFKATTVPFLIAVQGKTMILGWRGTNTLSDALNDGAAAPQSNYAWRKHAKTIKAQGAMTSIVVNDIVTHEDFIISEIKKRGITEIVTTGQSLGGGCSQIGHLVLRAQIQDERSSFYELNGKVNVRSVAFCGPMTTVLVDNATAETDAFVKELEDNSCNFIFSNDPVPRAYGYLTFIDELVKNAAPDLMDQNVPWAIRGVLKMRKSLNKIYNQTTGHEQFKDFVDVMIQYVHVGKLIYYAKEDSKPRVLRDLGADSEEAKAGADILRDAKYQDVEDFNIDDLMHWHMHIIRGPGLGYKKDELS